MFRSFQKLSTAFALVTLAACSSSGGDDAVAAPSADVAADAPPYVVVAIAKVKPGTQGDFEQAARTLVDGTRKEPGNVSYRLHISNADPTEFVFFETWKDQAASDAHMNGPVLGTFFAHVKDDFETGYPVITPVHEVDAL